MEIHMATRGATIFSHFVATRGPTSGQRDRKANQFGTVTQKVYRSSLNWIAWLLFSDNGRKPPFLAILWALECRNFANVGQKHESLLHTHPGNAYTKFELNWMISLPDNGLKPRRDGRTDGQMDGRSPFLCPFPTSSAGTITELQN